jgi:hypothetical protein
MMNKSMLSRTIETLLAPVFDRSVEVNFSHLGKDKDYGITIQKTLYEFEENSNGPKGPMYVTLNTYLLQDTESLLKTLGEIIESRK